MVPSPHEAPDSKERKLLIAVMTLVAGVMGQAWYEQCGSLGRLYSSMTCRVGACVTCHKHDVNIRPSCTWCSCHSVATTAWYGTAAPCNLPVAQWAGVCWWCHSVPPPLLFFSLAAVTADLVPAMNTARDWSVYPGADDWQIGQGEGLINLWRMKHVTSILCI